MGNLTNFDAVRHSLESASLDKYAPMILPLAKPTIRMHCELYDLDRIPRGASRLGGVPDLPVDVEWPGKLNFIGQIHLPDVAPYDIQNLLPRFGWLYFFYDADEQPWGYDPRHVGFSQVLYYDGPQEKLRRIDPAADDVPYTFPSCILEFDTQYTLPMGSDFASEVGLSREEEDRYWALIDISKDPEHQLLGNPSQIQNDMPIECQLVSNGLFCGDPSGFNDPRRLELEAGADDWTLLCQIDTDDSLGMVWGDCGMIYYWIRKQDLADRQFDKTWLILQCT